MGTEPLLNNYQKIAQPIFTPQPQFNYNSQIGAYPHMQVQKQQA